MKYIKGYQDLLLENNEQAELDRDLIYHVRMDRPKMVKAVLELGANPNAIVDGYTPLGWAARKHHVEIVKILLEAGADPNTKIPTTKKGTYAICEAVSNMNPASSELKMRGQRVIELLLEAGADPNSTEGGYNRTCLAIMAWDFSTYSKDMLDLFLQYGADPNIPDIHGKVALHWPVKYARRDDVNLAKYLILGGADPFLVFESAQQMLDFFDGNIGWLPDGDLKRRIQLAKRSKKMFGI